jgi:ankyrin repeat protein
VGFPIFDSLEELAAYYRAEKAEWVVAEAKRSAKADLLEMGISWHADALVQCVSEGDIHAVDLFMKSGFLPEARDKHGVPLLSLAVRAKHRGVVDLLLDAGAGLNSVSEDRGYSPLMDAVLNGSSELLELFLRRGADPNLASKDGQTAIVIAAGKGDVEAVRRLLDYGADPDLPDKLGFSARKYAKLFKNAAITELIEARSPAPLLH